MKTNTQKSSATERVGRGGMATGWTHRRTSWVAISAMAMGWIASSMNASAAYNVSIDGGTTWTGWTSRGISNTTALWASGVTNTPYEVYTTIFTFDSVAHVKTGSPLGGGPTGGSTGFGTSTNSSGAFVTGNRILGVGVRRDTALPAMIPTVKFDLNSNSFAAASTVGGSDGKSSFGTYSQNKDFTAQFQSADQGGGNGAWNGYTFNTQAGEGSFYGGPSTVQTINVGNLSGDWAFRAFAQTNSYQMFFDIDAMDDIYGLNDFVNPFAGIGTVGSTVNLALAGLGNAGNEVAFPAPADPTPVPEPANAVTVLALFSGAVLQRRKRVVKH
jgi:hypothetical protein